MNNELYHHGILGQRWGVRRYQNEDGTLTKAGIKRYYTKDQYGRDVLNKRGEKENKKKTAKFNRYVNTVKYKVELADPEFKQIKKAYFEANKKDSEDYDKEHKRWLNGEKPYKNKDFYEFKDIAYEKWIDSDDGKLEAKLEKDLRKKIESAAKEHPIFDKTFYKLKDVSSSDFLGKPTELEKIEYGHAAVNRIMDEIAFESLEYRRRNISDTKIKKM